MIITDVEASGLDPESYPIQIALYHVESDSHEVFYIKPAESWTFWSENAENIHNIPRSMLYDVGISVTDAVKRIHDFLEKFDEDMLFSDAPTFERFWYSVLYKEAKADMTSLTFLHIGSKVQNHEQFEEILRIMGEQDRLHDALDDCRQMANAYREATSKYK